MSFFLKSSLKKDLGKKIQQNNQKIIITKR
jgi:hypothetical protein